MTEDGRDPSEAIDSATDRQRERAETVEHVLERTEADFGGLEYPVRAEELATQYGDTVLDLPNETESLGSVFDRLVGEEYESPEEVREAVTGELTGKAEGMAEGNEARNLEDAAEPEDRESL